MADLRLVPPTLADVARELARPVPPAAQKSFDEQLAEQIRCHAGALGEIREALTARKYSTGEGPGEDAARCKLGCALADLDEAAAQLSRKDEEAPDGR